MTHPHLIVMLTFNDHTVLNSREIFEACRETKAEYFGFKEEPLPPDQMAELFALMKACGKKTVLEVVTYTEDEGFAGAQLAHECGVDVLMGTKFSPRIADYCKEHGMAYMPFVGTVEGRPSVLGGSLEDMLAEARTCLDYGVDGFDLLGYRFEGDARALIDGFVREVNAPVCVAGSIDCHERLDDMATISPWAFTIGSAFFDNRFGESMPEQIDHVYDYIRVGAQ